MVAASSGFYESRPFRLFQQIMQTTKNRPLCFSTKSEPTQNILGFGPLHRLLPSSIRRDGDSMAWRRAERMENRGVQRRLRGPRAQ